MNDKDAPVPSPCVRNCCLDLDDTCLGCFRSLQEILNWGAADNSERSAIVVAAKRRRGLRARRQG